MIASDVRSERHQEVPRFEYDAVDGGTLVYVVREARENVEQQAVIERRLYGFADVSDWSAIRAELGRRGHDVGALHHLPTLR